MHKNPNQQRVFDFMIKIPAQSSDIPYAPSIPSLRVRISRARLMMEELMETIQDGLGLDIWVVKDRNNPSAQRTIDFEDIHFEESFVRASNLILIADGLVDCEVVNHGTAVVCGIETQPIFDVVMDNNMLKLKTGTIDEHGKLVKAKNHPKPDIQTELEKQMKKT